MKDRVLVIDIGGSHVKIMMSPARSLQFDSGPEMRPRDFVAQFHRTVRDLRFDKVSIGFPAPVRDGKIISAPTHLRKEWKGFKLERVMDKPVRVVNDAAMQALGSHVAGRTLFLGLGTGLGSALVWSNNVLSLELGHLPYRDHKRIELRLGKPGLERLGRRAWRGEVRYAILQLKRAFIADAIILGGGNVHNMGRLPAGVHPGHNRNAFLGGKRLWETDRKTGKPRWNVM
ncbi:MAG: ROK family protein [Verrucomicrobia bacterium]|nr:ROK family protein [Verrucomicrobiota bacterium]